MATTENAQYELRRLTPVGEPPAFSLLLFSLLSSFSGAAFDCPDLALLEPFLAGRRGGKEASDPLIAVLHLLLSHTDPDHMDIKSGKEWRQPVLIHPLSWVLFQYLQLYVGKNPDENIKLPQYKNVSHFETEKPIEIPGLGTVTAYPFSHGTFLHGFFIETKQGQTILIVPDSTMGSATEQSIEKIKQRLGGKQLDIFIGDFKNYGSSQSLTADQQVDRLEGALAMAAGQVFNSKAKSIKLLENQVPVIAYIKPGHIIQLENWWQKKVFSQVPTYLSPRLHELLGPKFMGTDPNGPWCQIHEQTKPLAAEDSSVLRGMQALYITDNRYDQTRYSENHIFFVCSRSSDSPSSTERGSLTVAGGMSGHDPRASFEIIKQLRPKRIGLSHNGTAKGAGNVENLAKHLITNYPDIGELILPQKGSKHRF